MHTDADLLDRIRRYGREAYPEEGCGFLLGTAQSGENHVVRVEAAGNEHGGERERRYSISPRAYRAAQTAAEESGLDVVGFYHSHPDHPARPSRTDLEEATFPGYTYVIVAVEDGAPADLTAWTLAPDRSRFVEEKITVKEDLMR